MPSTHREAAAGRRRRGKPVFACTLAARRSSAIGRQGSQTGLSRRSRSAGLCLGRWQKGCAGTYLSHSGPASPTSRHPGAGGPRRRHSDQAVSARSTIARARSSPDRCARSCQRMTSSFFTRSGASCSSARSSLICPQPTCWVGSLYMSKAAWRGMSQYAVVDVPPREVDSGAMSSLDGVQEQGRQSAEVCDLQGHVTHAVIVAAARGGALLCGPRPEPPAARTGPQAARPADERAKAREAARSAAALISTRTTQQRIDGHPAAGRCVCQPSGIHTIGQITQNWE